MFTATLNITAKSENALTEYALQHLKERGYHVTRPKENWESVRDFLKRVKMNRHEKLSRKLKKWEERGYKIPVRRGKSGRAIELLSNPKFEEFLTQII